MTKDFYIIKMMTSFNGVRWHKILDTPKGMSWYNCVIQDNKITWKFNGNERGKCIRDYEHNFIILDYEQSIHGEMIINDMKKV